MSNSSIVSPLSLRVEHLKTVTEREWRAASSSVPAFEGTYSRAEQLAKEQDIDHRFDETEAASRQVSAVRENGARLVAIRKRLRNSIVQFLHSFDCVISPDMEERFSAVTDDFIRQAYDFDPAADEQDVYQASRNVMIMNTFQMHLGLEVRLTPAVFAYSMLYPVTDNYLDATNIGDAAKVEANRRLRDRLMGIGDSPRNTYERTVDALVKMIEGEFDRKEYPLVYDSLLAIHGAQCRSVTQQRGTPPDGDLLDISIEKGGTSVLADGYLVAGTLSAADEEFFFRFGVLLQLIDDLQDLREDAAQGQQTLALRAAETGCLEDFTNRLSSYMTVVLAPDSGKSLRRLIDRSCRLLILEAVASNAAYYGDEYLLRMERLAPVRFGYLRAIKTRLRDRRGVAGTYPAIYGLRRTADRTAA